MERIDEVPPAWRALGKADIERLYQLAYVVDPSVFTPEDAVEFGLDVHRLKEFGQARMSKPLAQLRRRLPDFWRRLDRQIRSLFLAGRLADALLGIEPLVKDLEQEMGELKDLRGGLGWMRSSLFGLFPKSVEAKLKEGQGKWSNGGGGKDAGE